MKFNEWLTHKDDNFSELSSDLGMESQEDLSLIENQLEQWVDRLNGLIFNLPKETRDKLLEKVISRINTL